MKTGVSELLPLDRLLCLGTAKINDAATADESLKPQRGDVYGAAVKMHGRINVCAHMRRQVNRRDIRYAAVIDALVPENLKRRIARKDGRAGAYGRGYVPKAAHAVPS